MYKIPESLIADIKYNQQLIEQFNKGEISGAQLKSHRVPMGIYEQRQDGHYMLRIRCTGGLITPRQLRRVAAVARQVECSHIHITTRQEVQIHDVSINQAIPALISLQEEGLSTQGGGGNTIRNILVNELGGISDRQTFDPYPYAIGLTTRLIAEKDSWSMPRKLKIAFDMNEEDANFSLVADLGLIPLIKDGQRGFRVLLGGSVASRPHKGWQIFDFLPEKDLFRAAKAAKNFFNLNGNRKNRYKARIRYIFYKNGEEEAKRLYFEEYDKLVNETSLDFEPAILPFEYKEPKFASINDESEAFKTWKHRYTQKQSVFADILIQNARKLYKRHYQAHSRKPRKDHEVADREDLPLVGSLIKAEAYHSLIHGQRKYRYQPVCDLHDKVCLPELLGGEVVGVDRHQKQHQNL